MDSYGKALQDALADVGVNVEAIMSLPTDAIPRVSLEAMLRGDDETIGRVRKLDWATWLAKGWELFGAARTLNKNPDPQWKERGCPAKDQGRARAQELMLIAFALENFFKSVLVHQWPEILKDAPRRLFSHDLVRLAQDAKLDPTSDEIALLSVLTEFGRWVGRYPFPTDVANGVSYTWDPTHEARLIRDLLHRVELQAGLRV